jgi:2-iminobutanoate/2-iminopropanoate deaminase
MKQAIRTDKAPGAIGPYSQAIKTPNGKFIYCSGQIPLNPATKEIAGKTAAEQCRQVMDNIGELLNAGGANYTDIVKTTIFLTDMNDFEAVNSVYATYFDSEPPARSTVQVSRLPRDVKIEIEAIAVVE